MIIRGCHLVYTLKLTDSCNCITQCTFKKPKPVVKLEEVEVNGKIVFDQEGRREVAENVLPKDGDM